MCILGKWIRKKLMKLDFAQSRTLSNCSGKRIPLKRSFNFNEPSRKPVALQVSSRNSIVWKGYTLKTSFFILFSGTSMHIADFYTRHLFRKLSSFHTLHAFDWLKGQRLCLNFRQNLTLIDSSRWNRLVIWSALYCG